MTPGIKEMMDAANAAVPWITPPEAQALIAGGDVLVIDVREASELEASGKIASAVNISGGILEFRADPQSAHYDPRFDRTKTIILYCASGGRSALAGKRLKDMGYEQVFNLGGFNQWVAAGGKVEACS